MLQYSEDERLPWKVWSSGAAAATRREEDGTLAILKPDKQNLMKIKIVCSLESNTGTPSAYSSDLCA